MLQYERKLSCLVIWGRNRQPSRPCGLWRDAGMPPSL